MLALYYTKVLAAKLPERTFDWLVTRLVNFLTMLAAALAEKLVKRTFEPLDSLRPRLLNF